MKNHADKIESSIKKAVPKVTKIYIEPESIKKKLGVSKSGKSVQMNISQNSVN